MLLPRSGRGLWPLQGLGIKINLFFFKSTIEPNHFLQRGIVSLSANEFLSVTPFHRRRKQRSLNGEEHHLIRRISWKAKPSIRPIAEEFERGRRRRRRDAPKRQQGITIETAVFVDAYLYSHMTRTHFLGDDAEKEMTHFVLAMINAVISV